MFIVGLSISIDICINDMKIDDNPASLFHIAISIWGNILYIVNISHKYEHVFYL